MKKRKTTRYIIYVLLGVLLFSVGYLGGSRCIIHSGSVEQKEENQFLKGVTGVFSSEPSEIQALREKEVVQQEEGYTEFYFQQLNEDEQRAYREILDGVRNMEEEFYVSISGDEELDRAYHAVLKDHPEIFWIHNREEVYRTTYGDSSYCLLAPGYGYAEDEIAGIQQSMEDGYQEVLSLIPEGADTYEIVKTVYTYIIDETEYVTSDHDQSIAGVFSDKNAVCAGYAGATQYLLERMGIFCIYVDGSVLGRDDGHAWNIVQIDGEYYYVDTTNGDQPEFLIGDAAVLAEHKTTVMDYLCPFPEEYEATYFASDEFEIPSCTSHEKNFYVLNQGCFDSYERSELYDYCCMRIDNNAAVVRFKYSNQEAFDAACEEYIDNGAVQDVAQYYMRVHGLSEVQYHYGVLEDFKTVYFIF